MGPFETRVISSRPASTFLARAGLSALHIRNPGPRRLAYGFAAADKLIPLRRLSLAIS